MNPRRNPRETSAFVPFHPRERRRALTVIELLVVMAVTALLPAMLCPAVQRASRHARAVACRSQLRQWGLALSLFLDEHDPAVLGTNFLQLDPWQPGGERRDGPYLCPMATRYESNENTPFRADLERIGCGIGGKFTAWKLPAPTPREPGIVNAQGSPTGDRLPVGTQSCIGGPPLLGSYGANSSGFAFLDTRGRGDAKCSVRRAGRSCIPILLDCVQPYALASTDDDPPAYEGQLANPADIKSWCLDRHQGTINGLFLDASVRRVGLKELWTLAWWPRFDIRNRWTRAGGVQPDDWPTWMRKFRDY